MKREMVQELKPNKIRQRKIIRSLTAKMETGAQKFTRENADVKWYKTLRNNREHSEDSTLTLLRISLHYRAPRAESCPLQVQLSSWEISIEYLKRVMRTHSLLVLSLCVCWPTDNWFTLLTSVYSTSKVSYFILNEWD